MTSDPGKVVCLGEGLHFGYFRHPIHATVDTRHAGPGELTVYCDGPRNRAFCELSDHHDGTFTLTVRPQDVGMHALYIKYDDVNVPGSPYSLRVSSASLVRVQGSGLSHDVLRRNADFEFQLVTKDAGNGEIKVRVGGPSGGFKVQTKSEGSVVRCRYNPQMSGLYTVHVLWSGDHVPGSPYNVFLARNDEELAQYLSRTSSA